MTAKLIPASDEDGASLGTENRSNSKVRVRARATEKHTNWHQWFAWRPVLLRESNTWVWLERLYRRRIYDTESFYFWVYKDGVCK